MSVKWDALDERRFEELCCQLARSYVSDQEGTFYRVEGRGGDEGVEAFFVFPDGTEWGWQAKFFLGRLNPSRWQQIRRSIDQALRHHPALRRYYVCLPINLTPREIRKWNKLVSEYHSKVELELWGASYLEDLLTRPESAGKRAFFFGELELHGDWFRAKLDEARASLGERYTPDVRVVLPELFDYFEVLGRTRRFRDKLLEWSNRINRHREQLEYEYSANYPLEICKEIVDRLDRISKLLRQSAEISEPRHKLPVEELVKEAKEAEQRVWEAWQSPKIFGTIRRKKSYEAYADCLRKIAILLGEFVEAIEKQKWSLANEVGFALYGEAGVGKSHCLMDIALSRQEQGLFSIFILGHQFPTNSQPIADLATLLGLGSHPEEVILGALSSAAESTGAPLILFIDALNESERRSYWASYLPALVDKLRRYPWLRMIVSYRTAYRQELMGERQLMPEIEHPGFAGHEIEALSRLCAFYGVEFPSLPILSPEFHNPLFLHLVLRALKNVGETVWPRGLHGFKKAYELFISNCNKRIARRLDCDPDAGWVRRAIQALARRMADSGRNWIAVEEAKQVIDEVYPERATRIDYSRSLFRALVDEHVITVDRMWDPDRGEWVEAVRVTFQRFADHEIAERLLALLGDRPDDEDLRAAFGVGGIIDLRSLGSSVIEALAIQLPERFGKELVDYIDHADLRHLMRQALLHSFVWRDPNAFPPVERLQAYINEKLGGLTDEVFDVLLTVCARPEHPLNADFLHRNLVRLPMAERDAVWTLYLHRSFGEPGPPIRRLLDWGGKADFSKVDRQCVELFATAVCWLFTSSNRELRDRATKVLARIFYQRLDCAKAILERFRDVDDLYVKERLYGAVYGACLWQNRRQRDLLADLAQWFYDQEFKGGSPLLHLLARDYARGVVEVAARADALPEGLELERVRPPYRSPWPLEDAPPLPSEDQLEKGSGLLAIVMSLRGDQGDFARYVESRVRLFLCPSREGQQVDVGHALRWIYARILELGYRDDFFAEHDVLHPDVLYTYSGQMYNRHERIGKKYQWIALHEYLARLSDNCLPQWGSYGATAYNGPWEMLMRDIDPSCWLEIKPEVHTPKLSWRVPFIEPPSRGDWKEYVEWVCRKDDLPYYSEQLKRSLLVSDPNGQQWILAHIECYRHVVREYGEGIEYSNPWWKGTTWLEVCGYLVKEPRAVLNWSRRQGFWNYWMPGWGGDSADNAFLGEYPWHLSWKGLRERTTWQKPQKPKRRGRCRYWFLVTYVSFPPDVLSSGTPWLLLPNPWITEEGGLWFDPDIPAWRDRRGHIVAWYLTGISESTVNHVFKKILLFRADWLAEFLNSKGLGFFWAVDGFKECEKFCAHNHIQQRVMNHLSGGFLWTDSGIEGTLRSVAVFSGREEGLVCGIKNCSSPD
jgi:hypothetical protein